MGDDRGGGPGAGVPRIVRVGRAAWSVLGVVGVLIVVWLSVSYLAVVVIPLVLALVVAAALTPVVNLFVKIRLPRPLAALVTEVAAAAVVAGVFALVVPAFIAQLSELRQSLSRAMQKLDAWLAQLPFYGPKLEVQAIAAHVMNQFFGGGSIAAAIGTVVTVLAATVLLIVIVFFYLAQGRWLAAALVGWLPDARQGDVWHVAIQMWHTVGRYFIALLVVALFDAVFIGGGLFVLNVPLALPLAVLVYLGAFLPYIGAVISGLLAALVALAERGLLTALIVVGLVLVVQQLEGNIIQPLVMGQVVQLPAFVVLLAIAVGAVSLGILGAFLAVPVAASMERVLRHLTQVQGKSPPGG